MGKPIRPKSLDAALAYFREWGAEGGKIGGKSRMAKLTLEERKALARKAAKARWAKQRKQGKG
jgi:hypothetical protein